ncbi:protein NLRC3-like [Channa argus]|uniref:protein NLRC3-like n=1 Tax=Channa argus TaxID=215402 RepID=UPI003522C133
MSQCKDTGGGVPQVGEHETQGSEQQHQPDCPELVCQSSASDISNDRIIDFKDSAQQHRPDSSDLLGQSSASDISNDRIIDFKEGQENLDSVFGPLKENIVTFVEKKLKKFQKLVTLDNLEEVLKSSLDDDEILGGTEGWQRSSIRDAFLEITLNFLKLMKKDDLADLLQKKTSAVKSHGKFKSNLKEKFQCVFEGPDNTGTPVPLNQIYTELYITEGGTGEVNEEHEVRQIETASRKPDRPETIIRHEDIFKVSPGRDEPIRRVMTKGVAGIGKTVLMKKFTLNWAEDKANQDIQFTFPLTFRELNVLKEKKFNLVELVHHFFPETKEAGISSFEEFQVMFIFDGLDECQLPLDFHSNEILTDVTESTSVDFLLTNLIRGNLLPSARLWITTRPAAANQIPPECVDMVTEVRGFTDPQKEEYFRKRFRDEEQASRIISHIKTSRSLHIMCHIPVFCWITATALEDVLKTREGGELHKTLTEMYIHFLVVQTKLKNIKYDGGAETDPHWSPENKKMIKSLGKLAFEQLQKGNLIFYESDLTECGIDIRAASVYSGVFTQIFKEERGLYQDKVFCFVHLSVQEFLAALHVHRTFINSGVNLLSEEQSISQMFYQVALDKALQSPNRHLDLFLRFLMGLSLETNQSLLQGLLIETRSSSLTKEEAVGSIKKKLNEDLIPQQSINLFHCLNELGNRSLVEEIQQYQRVDNSGPQWTRAGLRKYACELTVDTNTVNRNIRLSNNNRTMTYVMEFHSYPDHRDRFDFCPQLLCSNGLTGRCYWEVDWRGHVDIFMRYREIRRKGDSGLWRLGSTEQFWSLSCSADGYSVCDKQQRTSITVSSSVSDRVAVYVDCPAGSLSFYSVSSDELIHLHTFNTTFTEPLCLGFGFWDKVPGSSVSLCPLCSEGSMKPQE